MDLHLACVEVGSGILDSVDGREVAWDLGPEYTDRGEGRGSASINLFIGGDAVQWGDR